MGVIDSFKKFSVESARLNELNALRDECYKIVQYPEFYTLKVMENVLDSKWQVLFDKLYMSANYRNLNEYFEKMKEGHINRQQFAEIAKREFVYVLAKLEKLQESVESYAKEFSTAYNEFFSKGASEENDFGKKIICIVLMQPEAKEIIMEFLKL